MIRGFYGRNLATIFRTNYDQLFGGGSTAFSKAAFEMGYFLQSIIELRYGFYEVAHDGGNFEMNKTITMILLCLAAAKALALQVTLTDVERVENGRTALCIYKGHNITRTIEVPASQDCKAAMSFETDS